MEEIKRIAVDDLTLITESAGLTKKELDKIWPVKRSAFEVY
jgi:hypothetical protein